MSPSFYSHLQYFMISPYISPCLFHISYISYISLYLLISNLSLDISLYLILSCASQCIFLFLTISVSISLYLHISLHTSLQLGNIWLGPKTIEYHMAVPWKNYVLSVISPYILHMSSHLGISPHILIYLSISVHISV